MLIENTALIMSAYLDQNVLETFDANRQRLLLRKFLYCNKHYLDQNKAGTFGSNGEHLCLANSFVVTSVYLNKLNPRILAAMGSAFALPT